MLGCTPGNRDMVVSQAMLGKVIWPKGKSALIRWRYSSVSFFRKTAPGAKRRVDTRHLVGTAPRLHWMPLKCPLKFSIASGPIPRKKTRRTSAAQSACGQ